MGWIYDLIVYAVIAFIFLVRNKTGKKISLLFATIYAAISCLIYFEKTKYMVILHSIIGLLAVVLLFIVEFKNQNSQKGKKSKIVTCILSFFLGSFGAHHFYLGYWYKACLYILFSWTTIPLFLSMIEAIAILFLQRNMFEKFYCEMWFKNKFKFKHKEKNNNTPNVITPATNTLENEKLHQANVIVYNSKNIKNVTVDGNIGKFTIIVQTNSGPIHFLVEDGLIKSHYIEYTKSYKEYEVN